MASIETSTPSTEASMEAVKSFHGSAEASMEAMEASMEAPTLPWKLPHFRGNFQLLSLLKLPRKFPVEASVEVSIEFSTEVSIEATSMEASVEVVGISSRVVRKGECISGRNALSIQV